MKSRKIFICLVFIVVILISYIFGFKKYTSVTSGEAEKLEVEIVASNTCGTPIEKINTNGSLTINPTNNTEGTLSDIAEEDQWLNKVVGTGSYFGTVTKVSPIVNASGKIELSDSNTEKTYKYGNVFSYTGEAVIFEGLTIKYQGNELVEGRDYTITYRDNINVGKAVAVITGAGDYEGTFEINFYIEYLPEPTTNVYTGEAFPLVIARPEMDGRLYYFVDYYENGLGEPCGETLDESNYNIIGSTTIPTGVQKGEYVVQIYVKNPDRASFAMHLHSFILESSDKVGLVSENLFIEEIPDQEYTGSPIMPKPQVTYSSSGLDDATLRLVEGRDFDFEYENNTDIGEATIKVVGKGNYFGTVISKFQIIGPGTALVLTEERTEVEDIPTQTYTGSPITPKPKVEVIFYNNGTSGTTKELLIEGRDFDFDYENNIDVGEATIKIIGKNLYTGTVQKNFTIGPAITGETDDTKIIKELQIQKRPNKTNYIEHENFDPTGIELKVIYEDDTYELIGEDEIEIRDGNDLQYGQNSVTLTFSNDVSTSDFILSINVNPSKYLVNLELVSPPNKTSYKIGQSFNDNGMVIIATYSDGTRSQIYDYNIIDGDVLSSNQDYVTISYTYGGITRTVKQSISVSGIAITITQNVYLNKITVSRYPNKTKYVEGEDFDPTGMELFAFYSDGSRKTVTSFTVADGNSLKLGKNTVLILYTEDGITRTVKQDITVIASDENNNNQNNNGIEGIEFGYDIENSMVTNVKAKTPISAFKTEFLKKGDYDVVVLKNDIMVTEGYVETGMYAEIQDKNGQILTDKNGNLLIFQIIVKGDVNKDGLVTVLDSKLIKAYRAETITLTDIELKAADVNSDNQVSELDSRRILYHRAEVNGYNLNYQGE